MPARAILSPKPSDQTPARATVSPKPTLNTPARAIDIASAMETPPARAINSTNPTTATSALDTIRTLGELLDDIERVRIANGNRIAALEREHGSALPHLDVVQKQLAAVEHLAELELKRAWRKHPLAPWAKDIPGAGEKLVARLIAVIGDPTERENVAKLWAYCGHGDPQRKRAKGMGQAELFKMGNPHAKKRVYLLAAQFVKTVNPRSPYRDVYEQARERYADRLHESPCVRCGPSGHPAPAGSPWTLAHQHAAALRYVGKQFLKDLWIAAGHTHSDTQSTNARGGDA